MPKVYFHSNALRNVRKYIDLRARVIYINRAADQNALTIKIYG